MNHALQERPAPKVGLGQLLRRKDVERETGLCRSAIYQYMAEGRFPKPLKIGPRAVAWPASDIENWKAARLEGRS